MSMLKKYYILFVLFISALNVSAQNEVKPDGDKLIWVLLILVVTIILVLVFKKTGKRKKPLFIIQRIKIELEKNRLYYPDYVTLTVKNIGNTDIDLDRPLLTFDNFWLKRKFRLKGMERRTFYPLYLVKGNTHTLNIDLNHFYLYDRKLKRYPKVKITLFNVKGKQLGSNSVYLRKTLVKF
jgi:hypothetical protein